MPAHLRPPARTAAAVLLALSLAACGGGGSRPAETPAPSDSTTAQAPPRPRGEMAQTSAVTTIEGSDIRKVPVQRIEEYLQGRVPGLSVYRTQSGEYTMRIRGATKLGGGGDEEPLLVIDGLAVQQGALGQALMSLDPKDIAQVRVLKDASATAIYGSRGANGVLVIRTVGAAKRP